jgi:tetratricopeptide (TPR) repeat protein
MAAFQSRIMKSQVLLFLFFRSIVSSTIAITFHPALVMSLTGEVSKVTTDAATGALQRYKSGLSLLQNGKLRQAIDFFQAAIALKPDFIEARYSLGVAMLGGSEPGYPEAMSQFLEVLRLNPNHLEAHVELSTIFEKGGDVENAIAQLQEAARLAPKRAELLVLLGQKLQLAKRDDQAIQAFRHALDLDPGLDSAHYGIGVALQVLGREDEAVDEWNTALRINPANAYAHYGLGRQARQKAHWLQAETHLYKAIRLKPDFAEAHSELGQMYRTQKKTAQAEEAFQTALRRNSQLAKALYGLAMLYKDQGKPDQAKPLLERLQQLQPNGMEARRATVLDMGLKLMQEERLEEALAAFKEVTKIDPTLAVAAYNQAVALSRLGRRQEAIEAFREAIRLRPSFVMAHYGLAIMLKLTGDPTASEELRRTHLLNQLVPQPEGLGGAPILRDDEK